MDVDELKRMHFKGFMAEEEAVRLYELAREASGRGPCLEIGSYCGRSAAYLGMGCKENGGILFSLDHHEGSEEQQPGQEYFDPELLDPATGGMDTFPTFRKTIRNLSLEDTVVPLVSRSAVVARLWATPLSLIFIDGGHTFEDTFIDYSAWVSHLMPGGYLVIHDIFPDPEKGGQAPRCVYGMALDSGLFEELPLTGTLGVLRRAATGLLTDRSRMCWANIRG
ncbi:MAG: class I SAM-dependent methyltransferase [Proteobacteria bacterium]|nr:class I SAM-dependent methyltransferase [Pseudomonadota bacterium]MCG2741505.1 class I SAM-dependent methyltransferase [Syntrophaceae bacterium]MBU1743832.1 class I SAM-dependent methyltransferase [Pseudomonadota bacterium]MBU1964742.1 class I SAM-dependent methyltransferase [Pseudomonadota bacterium]MBU4370514.1 class I SAM-dependent methyltransferase [Pseudomonadota bacterium]